MNKTPPLNQLHICFLCNEYPPGAHGGIGTLVQTLGRSLVQLGHKVSVTGVYRISRDIHEVDNGVMVHRLRASKVRHAGFVQNNRRLVSQLRRINTLDPIDILEGPENGFAFLPRTLDVRKVLRMHGGHHFFHACLGKRPRAWRSWLERRSFSRADHLCGVSRFVAEETRRLLRLGDAPIEILPNPVDTERFHPTPDIAVIPGLIIFVGTLCEKKGIRQLVLGMPEILEKWPASKLVIWGRDTTDPATRNSYRAQLEAAVGGPARQSITFRGHIDNAQLPAQLATAEVLVYPSHMESQGIAIIEGMAMGKPVVASKAGPGPEIIEHGVSGLLCDPHDPHSIAQAVLRVLNDQDLANRLGSAARQRTLHQFSAEKLIGRNLEFYHRCLEQKSNE